MVILKIGRKICIKVVFFSKKKSLLKVFFQVQKWSSFGLIFMKLGLPEKLETLNTDPKRADSIQKNSTLTDSTLVYSTLTDSAQTYGLVVEC